MPTGILQLRTASGPEPQPAEIVAFEDEAALLPTGPEPTGLEQTGLEQTGPEPTGLDQTEPAPAGPDPTGPGCSVERLAASATVPVGPDLALEPLLSVETFGIAGELAVFLEALLDANPEPTVITHCRRILHVNREFTRLFGYSLIECVGDELADLLVPDGLRHEVEMIDHQIRCEGRAALETVRRGRDGSEIAVSVFVAPLKLSARDSGLFVTYRDIRKQKREEALLKFTALHDVLTGLANRALFLDRLELTMARLRRRPDRNFSILFIDLDGFKKVNDTLGHAAGDQLLLVVSDRLSRSVRPQDTVARFGGDEFAVLLDDIEGPGDIAAIAERLQGQIGEPIALDGGQQARVSASIGAALSSLAYSSGEAMMRDADHAMYDAKMAGKARHCIFPPRPAPARECYDALHEGQNPETQSRSGHTTGQIEAPVPRKPAAGERSGTRPSDRRAAKH